ncbi:MAG: hypothetical protein EWM73_03490 [Nitrospira sp.]|nr:MAG: hypothetical protein EWM73_03490 [Nitrospira sp.]
MNKICQSEAVLVLALVGLMSCEHEQRPVGNVNLAHVVDTQEALRDLWVGHIFWVRHVVLNNATHNPVARDAAEKEVVANTKQLARTMTSFYGDAASEKLFSLLAINDCAAQEYSDATVAGNKRQQDTALAHLASNADDVAIFLNGINPYLPKDTICGLIAAYGAHHVFQIAQCQDKDYAHVGATWPAMRQHDYVIADTVTTALVKQFPGKFS